MVIKLRSHLLGHHVHTTLFMGADADHLQNSGVLVTDVEQWCVLNVMLGTGQVALRRGPHATGLLFDDDPRLNEHLNQYLHRAQEMPPAPATTEEDARHAEVQADPPTIEP